VVRDISSSGSAPAAGSWGNWGTASTSNERRECDVEYVGGSAARARRVVRAQVFVCLDPVFEAR
jgi:hypothetical protein